jgi:poly-gamma-glutamate synthesis protein (capsule biosynthesis protein)
MTLFLCGDVMTGRGVDQVLSHPGDPRLAEPFVTDAREYVALAEARHGRIPAPAADHDIWGDALAEFDRVRPDLRVLNLETAVTTSAAVWPAKGINYRMHPRNVGCLAAIGPAVFSLANNHVLDFGYGGLEETLTTLARAGLAVAGAGRTRAEAEAPVVVAGERGSRAVVVAAADRTSGVPPEWAAADDRSGIALLRDLSDATADAIAARARLAGEPGDLVVVSVHWGANWGYEVPRDHARFARRLIDGGVGLVHGHSSHHPRPIEVYRGRLILYGCGDFLNDYEGIGGYERYRGDLVLMYFATFTAEPPTLEALELVPMRIRRIRLTRPPAADARWMRDTLDRISRPLGVRVAAGGDGALAVHWDRPDRG